MARIVLIVSLSFALANCASSVEDRMAEAKPVLDAWSKCIMRAVAQFEDGKSDPVSVAYGLTPKCARLYQQFTEKTVAAMSTDRGQTFMRNTAGSQEVKLATSAVLSYRAASPAGKRALISD